MKKRKNQATIGPDQNQISALPDTAAPASLSTRTATAEVPTAADTLHLVCFLLGNEEMAVPVDRVIEVVRGTGLNPITGSTRYLAGMLPYRTETIPVIHLKQWLDIPSPEAGAVPRVVVVSQGGKLVGLAVDEVTQVLRGERRFWQEPSGDTPRQHFLAGYYTEDERRIPILECNHLPGL
jgi:purine-binding chemotaxis protein CheW